MRVIQAVQDQQLLSRREFAAPGCEMSEEQTTFKVTDRRLFNADGSPRELAPDEQAAQESAPPPVKDVREQAVNTSAPSARTASAAQAAITQAAESDTEDEFDIPGVDDPASFINFAMSLASNAASALGMMEHPVTHKREVDLQLAKHWIDVLGMLQQKTLGNLSPEEAQILEGWLADLRMQYVSLTGSPAAKAARPLTGRDITGGR